MSARAGGAPPARAAVRADRWITAELAVLAVTVLALAAASVWALDRGFQIVDEGVYLLTYTDPRPRASSLPLYVASVFGSEPGVVTLRALRFVLMTASALAFGWAAGRRAQQQRWPGWTPRHSAGLALVCVLASTLPEASWLRTTLSYNSAAAIGSMTAATLLLLAGDPAATSRLRRGVILAACGFVCGVLFFWRPPAGALAFAAAGIVSLFPPHGGRTSDRLRGAVPLALGAAGAVAHFHLLLCPLGEWWSSIAAAGKNNWWTGIRGASPAAATGGIGETLSGAASAVVSKFGYYASDLGNEFRIARTRYWPALLPVAALAAWPHLRRRIPLRTGRIAAACLAAAFVALFAWVTVRRDVWRAGDAQPKGMGQPYIAVAMAVAVACGGCLLRRSARRTLRVPGLCLVAGAAAACAINLPGSALRPSILWAEYAAPVFVGCWLAAHWASSRLRTPALRLAVTAIWAATVASHVFWGLVASPRFQTGPLWTQTTEAAGLPRLAGVRLDPPTAAFFESVHAGIAEARGSGDPPKVAALFAMPGVLFATGSKAFGADWYDVTFPEAAVHMLRESGPAGRAVFLIDEARRDTIDPILSGAGIDLASTHRRTADVRNPYTGATLSVHVPR